MSEDNSIAASGEAIDGQQLPQGREPIAIEDLPEELSVEQSVTYLEIGDIEPPSSEDDEFVPGGGEQVAEEDISQAESVTGAPVAQDLPDGASLVGLGVDIIEIHRMEHILKRTPHFKERVYTEGEREYCDTKPNPVVHYALFFAAKEAVLKALGTGFRGMGINDVEVTHNRFGRPIVILSGHAAEIAEEQGIHEVYLSLSYTHTTGVASAVAARKENIPERQTVVDTQEKLAQQFKDMRAMLDEIDAKLTEIENAGGLEKALQDEAAAEDAGNDAQPETDEYGESEGGIR